MRRWKRAPRPVWALLAVGLALIGCGLFRGEHLTVLKKAVRICLECIGIG